MLCALQVAQRPMEREQHQEKLINQTAVTLGVFKQPHADIASYITQMYFLCAG